MADDARVGVGVAADGMPILQAVEALVDSSRLCGRCRHRGLLSVSSTKFWQPLTKLRAKVRAQHRFLERVRSGSDYSRYAILAG